MKKVLYLFLMFSISSLVLSSSCKKGGGGGSNEAALVVELSPAANSNQPPAPGPDFPLTVTIKSTMPPSGVTIDVVAREDVAGSTPFFSQSISSTTAANNFNITNSPRSVTIRVNVTVTSKTDASNKFTGSYTYSRK